MPFPILKNIYVNEKEKDILKTNSLDVAGEEIETAVYEKREGKA